MASDELSPYLSDIILYVDCCIYTNTPPSLLQTQPFEPQWLTIFNGLSLIHNVMMAFIETAGCYLCNDVSTNKIIKVFKFI